MREEVVVATIMAAVAELRLFHRGSTPILKQLRQVAVMVPEALALDSKRLHHHAEEMAETA